MREHLEPLMTALMRLQNASAKEIGGRNVMRLDSQCTRQPSVYSDPRTTRGLRTSQWDTTVRTVIGRDQRDI